MLDPGLELEHFSLDSFSITGEEGDDDDEFEYWEDTEFEFLDSRPTAIEKEMLIDTFLERTRIKETSKRNHTCLCSICINTCLPDLTNI